MDDSERKHPTVVRLSPNHIGAIGEALFAAQYEPPSPLPQIIRNFCVDIAPDWVSVDDLNIQARLEDTGTTHVIDFEGDILRWKNDARITAWCRPFMNERDDIESEIPIDGWRYHFPVEIKTGPGASLEHNQRAVMEHLAKRDGTQPIIIRFDIDALPNSFKVNDVELVSFE